LDKTKQTDEHSQNSLFLFWFCFSQTQGVVFLQDHDMPYSNMFCLESDMKACMESSCFSWWSLAQWPVV